MSDQSLYSQQSLYRYDPNALNPEGGPSRIFPYRGTEGMLRYILDEIGEDLIHQAQLPSPILEALKAFGELGKNAEETWLKLTTILVDLEFFQSNLFNFTLPPGEQFSSEFVRLRRVMGGALVAARNAAAGNANLEQQRLLFYQALEKSDWHRQALKHSARPAVAAIYERDGGLSDREFARQRVAGPNPIQICRVQARSQLEGLRPAHTLANGETIEIADAAAQNRLFMIDYPFLNLAPEALQIGRYVGSPKAFFYNTNQGLEPLFIQVEPGGKVYTPNDADDWMRAKLYVQVADITQHELITHLGFTHLAMEAFAIATPRRLPSAHALHRLLRPHFKFLLAINTRGNAILLGEGAAIDNLMAPTREVSLSIINQSYRATSFASHGLPTDLSRRGVEPEFLADYPYRDDAQLLWDAIHRYVTNYVQQYYRTDADVQQDADLQAWAAELGLPLAQRSPQEFAQAPDWLPPEIVAKTGLAVELPAYPRVPDFPTAAHPGRFTTVQQVIEVATQIIFTCSAQHAAVNFSQFDYFGFVPNSPLAAYTHPDVPASLEALLPSAEKELGQMELAFALSGIRWSRLGSSETIGFANPCDRKVLHIFQTELAQIGTIIDQRNAHRKATTQVDYPYLHPALIPNSINI
ncbi:lipoxygenase family protein [Myxacorys almedinensis]|uniref:Lipoxygenase n=1 Tax=Myxacorys almedinensis A TaxID=2690445 RepID=A0A8J7Z7K2_9CYAN|nr:lipoxygenase family protein [Myxacorys almedinensis]NDJ19376.1 lipoxygenase [Myxacorys almedinensis A]